MAVRQPTMTAGCTHASSVIPVVRSSEFESGTVTQSFAPSKRRAWPKRPIGTRTGPPSVPWLPVPDESTACVPLASSKP